MTNDEWKADKASGKIKKTGARSQTDCEADPSFLFGALRADHQVGHHKAPHEASHVGEVVDARDKKSEDGIIEKEKEEAIPPAK